MPLIDNMQKPLAVFVILLWFIPGNAQSFATRADKYLTAYAEQGKFMGAALVARDGRVLFERGYGSADLAWDVPITPQTKFNIASLTKQYDLAALSFGEKVTPAPRS